MPDLIPKAVMPDKRPSCQTRGGHGGLDPKGRHAGLDPASTFFLHSATRVASTRATDAGQITPAIG